MFGKSTYQITTSLGPQQVVDRLEGWSKNEGLKDVSGSSEATRKKYRFGSPLLSNPIYIEVSVDQASVEVCGWVQTMIPGVRWKLVEPPRESVTTKLDYRRKGGLLISKLRQALSPEPD